MLSEAMGSQAGSAAAWIPGTCGRAAAGSWMRRRMRPSPTLPRKTPATPIWSR